MCGICGKVGFASDAVISAGPLQGMLDAMQHRGPDEEGILLRPQVGLGHSRLSIIDLTTGHQPLSNEDGTVWIVFNGEIYNYQELRPYLANKGHVLKTQTDTEVIVHLYEELGPACVDRLRGMFAFAIWDENERRLLLARDRVGIKPLYYTLGRGFLAFASEIKALLADPEVDTTIAPEMIDRFLTFLYMPGEDTLFGKIRKLLPGHYLTVRDGQVDIRQYWDLKFSKPATRLTTRQYEEQLVALLGEVVQQHMIADVPVGVLLSGGVDSTAVLSFVRERTAKPVSTFTIGFSDAGVADERPYARLAADTYGTQHHEMTITAQDFVDFLPRYVWHMEEPVCEPPAVALYYISRLASRTVKVLLSGEGGDEAFAGYSNYRNLLWLERAKQGLGLFRRSLRDAITTANRVFHSPRVEKYLPLIEASFPGYYYSRTSNPYRFSGGGLSGIYNDDFADAVDRECSVAPMRSLQQQVRGKNTLDAMLYLDTKTWLPDDLLLKADKMTMANSVELRVPLLDHKLLEFAAALPPDLKVHGFATKYLAKKALEKRIPREIVRRRKAGFPVPYEGWLRNQLHGWVTEVLTDRCTLERGYFSGKAVRKLLAQDKLVGGRSKEIFSLLTLELWHRSFTEQNCAAVA